MDCFMHVLSWIMKVFFFVSVMCGTVFTVFTLGIGSAKLLGLGDVAAMCFVGAYTCIAMGTYFGIEECRRGLK